MLLVRIPAALGRRTCIALCIRALSLLVVATAASWLILLLGSLPLQLQVPPLAALIGVTAAAAADADRSFAAGISLPAFRSNIGLADNFNLVATSSDRRGQVYVDIIEGKNVGVTRNSLRMQTFYFCKREQL